MQQLHPVRSVVGELVSTVTGTIDIVALMPVRKDCMSVRKDCMSVRKDCRVVV
jgi:hypothetical protein